MKKEYITPIIKTNNISTEMAAPLAFFSAATAAAAVVGTVAGAAVTASAMGKNHININKSVSNKEILGLVI